VNIGQHIEWLAAADARQRVEWALEELPGPHVLSSSFGAQAAVLLHLVTQVAPRIPVVTVDTGYLFPETYRYIDVLAERLGLNLAVFASPQSPAWFEARHGKLWEQGRADLEYYLEERKVEPMRRGLAELGAATWFAGLRRDQSASRARLQPLERRDGRYKVHPIFDWTEADIERYMADHELPHHPLRAQGYVSIGDWHTTKSLYEVASPEELRFRGLKRECGLHGLDG